MSEVKLSSLSKTYPGGVEAVKKLELDLSEGELLVLVGPSGCGKSTTLRLLAGLEEVTSGTITVGARDVTNELPHKRELGMVFQNYALYPHKTIFENLAFGLKIRKVKSQERKTQISDIAQRLKIDDLLQRYPAQLSGGQKQRVALGRALLRGTSLILFDEPLSNLDAALRTQLRLEIAALHRERGFTGLFVTHDQTEAMALGSRIAVMKDGEILQAATPEEIYHRPLNRFVASFIGSPPMNFFEQSLKGGTFETCFTGKVPDKTASVGVRPEDLSLDKKSSMVISALVEQREMNGSEWYFYGKIGDENFICRSKVDVSVGDTVEFYVDETKLHFFDSMGKRL